MKFPNQSFWKVFKKTEGAFSTAEALALYNICLSVPTNQVCAEFGVYLGKSASVAVSALIDKNIIFYLVEPEAEDEDWKRKIAKTVNKASNGNIEIWVAPKTSIEFLKTNKNDFGYVFVDSGAHDDMVMEEVKLLEDRVIKDGIIAFHDFLNQFTAVERAYNYLISTGKYVPIPINWEEIFNYVKEHNLEEGNVSWHQYPELPHPPNFVGAVRKL